MNRKVLSIMLLWFLLISAACTTQTAPNSFPVEEAATTVPSELGSSEAVSQSGTITVMAAASLSEAFGEIGELFESQNPGIKVAFNFAGSQQLAQQIGQGAPADVFASANNTQMDAVIKSGLIDQSASQTFVRNRLVLIYPKPNPGQITSLQDLAKPGLKIVLAANEVPVGEYTLEFLDKASQDVSFGDTFQDDVIKNVVSYEENVKVVLTKVSLNEADAGIVYTTDAASAPENTIEQLEIPDDYNVIASYPIAAIKESSRPDLAKAFIDFVLSQTGQDILERYGFNPVTN